jgi:hypothetical protein
MMPETNMTDIASSHSSPLTGPSMLLMSDQFSLTLLTDQSDLGSMTTLDTWRQFEGFQNEVKDAHQFA